MRRSHNRAFNRTQGKFPAAKARLALCARRLRQTLARDPLKQYIPLLILSVLCADLAQGNSLVGCETRDGYRNLVREIAFTEEEHAAWMENDRRCNSVGKERVFTDIEENPDDWFPDSQSAEEVPWQDAKRLVWMGAVTTIQQLHNRRVYLLTRSGNSYFTEQPKLDDIFAVVRRVDPCGQFVRQITE